MSLHIKYKSTSAETNIVPLVGHVFAENTFRSRPPREDGARVLIGHINNRFEISIQPENSSK